ncbi:hypothetical protein J6TS7_10020 [Paenibacillus dendritiformis]|nr:hypothetical protein J6TS7_10020 [Paenibacillus dendritiformis]
MGKHLAEAAVAAAGGVYRGSEDEGERGCPNPCKSFFHENIPPGPSYPNRKADCYVLRHKKGMGDAAPAPDNGWTRERTRSIIACETATEYAY